MEVDGVSYFVGKLAEMEGATMAFTKDKSNHPHTIPLIFSAIALSQPDNPIIKVCLVTGLPLIDLVAQREDLQKTFWVNML